MFILSRDHGELFNAMYFSCGQTFHPVLVMPERLRASNSDAVAYRCYGYQSPRDIILALDREQPDVVILFSGYLMVINELFDEAELDSLIDAITSRGIPLATSDPTGGIIPAQGANTIEYRPGQRTLSKHLAWIAKRFSPFPHVYTAPPLKDAPNAVSFYNDAIIGNPAAPSALVNKERFDGLLKESPICLFVLSGEDFEIQQQRHGFLPFVALLSERIRDAISAGRRAVLVAPTECVEAVSPEFDDVVFEALAACPFDEFMALLLGCELAFYWNSFSASLVGRAMNGGPFFVFDRGHLADFLAPFFDRAQGQFYRGSAPPLLDVSLRLDFDELGDRARLHRESLGTALKYLATCPPPEVALDEIKRFTKRESKS